jgi:glucosamine--fructose-6-phosphate aminotransferase (isomerizing)
MCGINGVVGLNNISEVLFQGIRNLEYRGYDSSGMTVMGNGRLELVRAVGKLANLSPRLKSLPQESTLGIGHTRWATHGVPSVENAHPHRSQNLALVHNGIIENYQSIKILSIK